MLGKKLFSERRIGNILHHTIAREAWGNTLSLYNAICGVYHSFLIQEVQVPFGTRMAKHKAEEIVGSIRYLLVVMIAGSHMQWI